MNKYQEALKTVEKSCIGVAMEFNFGKLFEEDEKALSTLQELVEKATPKKVSITELHHIDVNIKRTKCPQCSMYIYGIIHISVIKFCNYCGQALDWSDYND